MKQSIPTRIFKLLRDALYAALALVSLFVFAAILFDLPLVEYLTPEKEINKDVVIKAIPRQVEQDKSQRDTRLSVCVDETGTRVSCN